MKNNRLLQPIIFLLYQGENPGGLVTPLPPKEGGAIGRFIGGVGRKLPGGHIIGGGGGGGEAVYSGPKKRRGGKSHIL